MNVAKVCYAQNFFTGDYKIDRKFSVRLFSQEITKFHKKSSVRLLSQEITKLDKKFSVRLFSQEITISQELFCSLFG